MRSAGPTRPSPFRTVEQTRPRLGGPLPAGDFPIASRVTSDLDPFAPDFRADPYPFYAQLRALGPIVWLERYGIWAVSRYEQVRDVLTDWQLFSNAGGGGLTNHFKEPPWRPPSIVLEADPPLHTRTRSVLARVLSPTAIRVLRGAFEREADTLIGRALERGSVEAIGELAQPFPLKVFPDAVGLGPDGRDNLLLYGAMVFGGFGPATPWYEALTRRAPEVSAWILAACARDALAPGGLGAAIHACADAGDITEAEAVLLVRSLLSAGVDTTIDAIGLTLRCLIEHPDQWQALRDNPALARNAFEEAARYDSSSQSLFRTTSRAAEYAGASLDQHDKVLVLIGSAGRDPAWWDDADRFDIRRKIAGTLAYGTGIHGCVAQMMARLEGEVFFQTFAGKVRTLESAGPAVFRSNPGLRGLSALPVRIS